MVNFDKKYYENIMNKFGYDPFEFWYFDFWFKTISPEELQLKYLCHFNAQKFSKWLDENKKCIVTTWFGMSWPPHVWTLSQIMRILRFQKKWIATQIVLGDLDAYNGKKKDLWYVIDITKRYKNFIKKLWFVEWEHSIIRNQIDSLEILQIMYISWKYMDDEMFDRAEEDLHSFYQKHNKVDVWMTYRRKLSLWLMIADFFDLWKKYDFVNVLLGIDEHKYVKFGVETLKKIQESHEIAFLDNLTLSATYTTLTKWFNGYPKQSKSFPESSINVESSPEDIIDKIMNKEWTYTDPEDSVVFQMMREISNYTLDEFKVIYNNCKEKNNEWTKNKKEFADYLISLLQLWE